MIRQFEKHIPFIADDAFVFENASVIGQVTLGKHVTIWTGAVLRGDIGTIEIGDCSNVQDNCVIHNTTGIPVRLGTYVTVGHGAILHSCTIGNGCLIGMGSIILDHAEIGDESMVGAGALITPGKKFPPRSLIIGSPAKAVRELTEEERKSIRVNSEHYVEMGKRYLVDQTP